VCIKKKNNNSEFSSGCLIDWHFCIEKTLFCRMKQDIFDKKGHWVWNLKKDRRAWMEFYLNKIQSNSTKFPSLMFYPFYGEKLPFSFTIDWICVRAEWHHLTWIQTKLPMNFRTCMMSIFIGTVIFYLSLSVSFAAQLPLNRILFYPNKEGHWIINSRLFAENQYHLRRI
jgi:hypothetical protein